VQPGGEGPYVCSSTCLTGWTPQTGCDLFPRIQHWSRQQLVLWQQKYSGGLENLVGLLENWEMPKEAVAPFCADEFGNPRTCVLRFGGALSAPWLAKELGNQTEPKYFYSASYYSAPKRLYDYNESLRVSSPPGTPNFLEIRRQLWNEDF